MISERSASRNSNELVLQLTLIPSARPSIVPANASLVFGDPSSTLKANALKLTNNATPSTNQPEPVSLAMVVTDSTMATVLSTTRSLARPLVLAMATVKKETTLADALNALSDMF